MVSPVFLHGRGLVSSLGAGLSSALARVATGNYAPTSLEVAPQLAWPYFAISDTEPDWYARARSLTLQAVAECGEVDRHQALFFASCSLDVGGIEEGESCLQDCMVFAEKVASWLNWQGPVYWISTACTSASNALLAALTTLRSGKAEEALVLGLELRNRFSCAGFGAMQLLDTKPPRPLGADRGGLVLGEAVAAIKLGTRPARWRLCGGANVVDGRDVAGASIEGVQTMSLRALADSGLNANDIDLIKLQAAGSPANDATEIAALRKVFTPLPALQSLKGLLGHTLGASGAAELALLTALIDHAQWPRHHHALDETLQAHFASAIPKRLRYAMCNILGFGGGHTALILERCP